MNKQLEEARAKMGVGDPQKLLRQAIPGRSTKPQRSASITKARRLRPPGLFFY
jgi:hypothetical protein